MNTKNSTIMNNSTTEAKHVSTPSDYSQCESDAIIKFTYFANNFTGDFVEKVWGNGSLGQHLKDKWEMLGQQLMAFKTASQHIKDGNYYGHGLSGTENFYKFYMMLDSYNKELLNNYISNNYNY